MEVFLATNLNKRVIFYFFFFSVLQTQLVPSGSAITKHPRNVKTTPINTGGVLTPSSDNNRKKERKISVYFQLLCLFLEIRQVPAFIEGRLITVTMV